MSESFYSDFQRRFMIMDQGTGTHVNGGYESDGSTTDLRVGHIVNHKDSRSGTYQDQVVYDIPSTTYNAHDIPDEPNSTTTQSTLESIENETEDFLNDRMVARAAHLAKMKDLVNANHTRVVEAFEFELSTECSIQEISPLCGSQLVAQSQQRAQSMLASKQILEKFNIPPNMMPRIDDAMDNEKQLVVSVTKSARKAGEEQKQLGDMEQKAYDAYLALIEKQHQERMELSKAFQDEKERHLNLWAASRTNTLDIVQSIESSSQHLLETLNILVETMKRHESRFEAEVHRVRVEEASTTSECKSECQVCYDQIEAPSSGRRSIFRSRHHVKKRSCLIPCNHAMICLPCATELWQSTKSCPFCKVTLTAKPLALYLG